MRLEFNACFYFCHEMHVHRTNMNIHPLLNRISFCFFLVLSSICMLFESEILLAIIKGDEL